MAQGPAAVKDYQPGIDAQHYAFTVVIPDSGHTIDLTATIYITRTRPVDTLRLDLEKAMHVSKVVMDTRTVTFARDDHTLRVVLPKWDPRCAGPQTSRGDRPETCLTWVTVSAKGAPASGLVITQDAKGRWQYFADHWPNAARQWLPTIDHPSDKATVEWRVLAPSSLKVVANGRMTEESPLPNEPGRSITAWQTERAIPPYLMVIAVAPMARIDLGDTACGLREGGGCVHQDVYEAPDLAPSTPPGVQAAGRIMEWMSRFVAPFPYERLSHLQSSTQYGGMENASAIFYASRSFQNMSLGEGTVAHETAHQWFGDAVTEQRWSDLWLSEGFATYFAALWEREARGDSAFRRALAGIRQNVLTNPVPKARPVIDTTETNLMSLLNRNSYEKGGFVLHMLRNEVGDSAWIRGIRAYYAAHKHGNALTVDLRHAIEAESKSDLAWFFDQWLTRPGYAELTVSWSYDETLQARIEQAPRFGAYRLTLPVEIEDANGVVTRTTIDVPASANAAVQLPGQFTQKPRRVTFDPQGDVLATIIAK